MADIKSKLVAIWKPVGPTSHDIIDQVRQITGLRKVGHAGTLDPLAEGILVIGLGRAATKNLGSIVAKDKDYLAEITLGASTNTYDREGVKQPATVKTIPSQEQIQEIINKNFIGQIEQIPPPFSAVKIGGQPAYALARAGQDPKLTSRLITIKDIKLINYAWPILTLKITTGPGAYIRSLAHDLGQILGTGGYLSKLIRTRVGQFTQQQSHQLSDLASALKPLIQD